MDGQCWYTFYFSESDEVRSIFGIRSLREICYIAQVDSLDATGCHIIAIVTRVRYGIGFIFRVFESLIYFFE
jgi:hypothetical protein